ncbi:MAG: hypothetical protein V3W14_06765 [Candidatus Neomarinimicrobiota bacterium]
MNSSIKPPAVIIPYNGTKFSDIFWSNLYGSLCRWGHMETRLIWMRYSAFLVVHAALVHLVGPEAIALAIKPESSTSWIVLILSFAGYLLGCFWWSMNYFGWWNQNLFYTYASNLKFEIQHPLPTDYWRGEDKIRPKGRIYSLAQSIVMFFLIMYSALLGLAVYHLVNCWMIIIPLLLLITTWIVFQIIKKRTINYIKETPLECLLT